MRGNLIDKEGVWSVRWILEKPVDNKKSILWKFWCSRDHLCFNYILVAEIDLELLDLIVGTQKKGWIIREK